MARGGARRGAGRPSVYANQPTVWLTIPVPADWAATWGPEDKLRGRVVRYLRKTTSAKRPWDRAGAVQAGEVGDEQ